MPFFDRFWWLRLLPSVLLATYVAVMGYFVLAFFPGDESAFHQPDAGVIGLLVFAGLVIVATLVIQFRQALAARRRHRLRLAALRGDPNAVPSSRFSRFVPDPGRAPDLSAGPLVQLWRPLRQRQRRAQPQLDPRIRRAVNVFQVVLIGGSFAYLLGLSIVDDLQRGESAVQALQHEAWLFGPIFAVAIAIFLVVSLGWRALVGLRGTQPYGVIATPEGIEERTPLGRRRMVRWEDARLLEIVSGPRFRLLGVRGFVQWSERAATSGDDVTPDGISREEMAARQRALLDLIAERTALTPRTFQRSLQPGGESWIRHRTRRESRNVALVLVAWLILLIAGTLAAPLGPLPAYNHAVAGLLAMAALLMPFAVEWGGVRAGRSAPSYTLPPAPDPSPADTYVLMLTAPRGLTLLRAAIALLLVGAGVVGYIPFSASSTYLLDAGVSTVVWSMLLTLGVGLTGCIAGLALLLFLFLLWYTTSVRADASGLRVNTASGGSTAAWSDIERIIVGVRDGRPRFYRVLGSHGKLLASWGPHFSLNSVRVANSGAISADQMVTVVAERSGISPEIVDAGGPLPESGDQG